MREVLRALKQAMLSTTAQRVACTAIVVAVLLSAGAGAEVAATKIRLIGNNGTVAGVTAGNALKVDGSSVTQPVSCSSGCGGAPLTGGATAVPTAANQGVALFGFNGTTLDALKTSAALGATNSGILATNICDAFASNCDQVTSLSADGVSVQRGLLTYTFGEFFSGTAWDRSRDTKAFGASDTGVAASDLCYSGNCANVDASHDLHVTQDNGPGVNSAGTGQYITVCNQSATINDSASGLSQIVALTAGKSIYVCGYDLETAGTAASNVYFEYGTGTNCGTGTGLSGLPGPIPFPASFAGITRGSGIGILFTVPSANALCLNESAAVQVSGTVQYTVY